jgi:hypothetical protein
MLMSCSHASNQGNIFIKVEIIPEEPGGQHYQLSLVPVDDDKKAYKWVEVHGDEKREKEISGTDLNEIERELRDVDMDALNDLYENFNVMDGGTKILTVELDGKKKVIKMTNREPQELRPFLRLIQESAR